jgi:hypothetical protein
MNLITGVYDDFREGIFHRLKNRAVKKTDFKEQKTSPLIKIKPLSEFSNSALQIVLPQLLWKSFDGIAQSSSWEGTVMLF